MCVSKKGIPLFSTGIVLVAGGHVQEGLLALLDEEADGVDLVLVGEGHLVVAAVCLGAAEPPGPRGAGEGRVAAVDAEPTVVEPVMGKVCLTFKYLCKCFFVPNLTYSPSLVKKYV